MDIAVASFFLNNSQKFTGDLANLFGKEGINISNHIKSTIRAGKEKQTITFCLAPDFGELTNDSIKCLDDHLKTAIMVTIKKLQKAKKGLSWQDVLNIMAQNEAVVPDERSTISRSETYTRYATDVFRVDGTARSEMVNEITEWFENIINDDNILAATQVDINDLATLVAETGVNISKGFVAASESDQKTVIDIGVIRFPQLNDPHFKVYRIKLDAWRHCDRVLMVERNENGLTCEFNSRIYKPNQEVLKKMKPESVARAASSLDAMFQ